LQRFDDGCLTLSWLSTADFDETGSVESFSEGVIDLLRGVEAPRSRRSCATGSARARATRGRCRCAPPDDDVDVSRVAAGRAAAGIAARRLPTQLADAELLVFLRSAIAEQLQ